METQVCFIVAVDNFTAFPFCNKKFKADCEGFFTGKVPLESSSKFYMSFHFSHYLYTCILPAHYTGLFKMIVRVLTTCHTQYTSDSSM
jgi:hypothetical protein